MPCCITSQNLESVKTCIAEQIGARADHFLSAIDKTIENLASLVVGSSFAATSLVSLGLHTKSVAKADEALHEGGGILQRLHYEMLKTLNPAAELRMGRSDSLTVEINNAASFGFKQTASESFLQRHVVSRLCFAGLALAAVAARTLQAALGVLCAAASLVTLGYFPDVNHTAYDCLGAPRILKDLFICALGIIHPQSLQPAMRNHF